MRTKLSIRRLVTLATLPVFAKNKAFEDYRTLSDLKAEVSAEPKALWRVVLELLLRDATWERRD